MAIAPPEPYARLERLLADGPGALEELERLVGETVALVAGHVPEVDTGGLRLGERVRPWRIEASDRRESDRSNASEEAQG